MEAVIEIVTCRFLRVWQYGDSIQVIVTNGSSELGRFYSNMAARNDLVDLEDLMDSDEEDVAPFPTYDEYPRTEDLECM